MVGWDIIGSWNSTYTGSQRGKLHRPPLPWLRTFWHGEPTSFGANATVVGTERDTVISELLVAAEDVVAATGVFGLEEVELAEVGAPADVGVFVREHATIAVERANNDIVIRILALFMGANSPL